MRTNNRIRRTLCAMLLIGVSVPWLSAVAQETRKAISRPAPPYPEAARKMQLSGTVKVQVVIGADGEIKETKIIGGHPFFVSTVEATLKKWKFAPGSGDTTAVLEFTFRP